MAISVNTATVPRKDRSGRTPFCKFFSSDNLSGCEQIMTLPEGHSGIYLKSIVIGSAVSLTVSIGDGETSNDLTTTVLGPITLNRDVGTPANHVAPAAIFHHTFDKELLFSTNLSIDASAAGAVWGVVEGFSI